MKRVIAKFFDSLGPEMSRKTKPARAPAPDPYEIAEVEQIVARFAARGSRSDALSDEKPLRSYLLDGRIALFKAKVAGDVRS